MLVNGFMSFGEEVSLEESAEDDGRFGFSTAGVFRPGEPLRLTLQ
jgi:hypothetical protein